MITVSIIEDDPEVREGLAVLLGEAEDFEIVGAHPECRSGVDAVLRDGPDVVLMDLDLPDESGIEGIRRLRSARPDLDILVLTILEKEDVVFRALRAGACGYLVKDDHPDRLLEAIREVMRGGAPMSTRIARLVVESLRPTHQTPSPLTPRETEVLSELCTGKSYRMIADALFISEETVRRHLKSIYRKLEVHSKSEAVARAFQDRLLDP